MIHPDVITLAVQSLANPDDNTLARAFADNAQDNHSDDPAAILAEFFATPVLDDEPEPQWVDIARKTVHYGTCGYLGKGSGRGKNFGLQILVHDHIWNVNKNVPSYSIKELPKQFCRRDSDGRWRYGFLNKLTAPCELVDHIAQYSLANLVHVVVACHHFSASGPGRVEFLKDKNKNRKCAKKHRLSKDVDFKKVAEAQRAKAQLNAILGKT